MSIVRLTKITWCGLRRDKTRTLESLQALGCLHIIPLARPAELRAPERPLQQTHEALKYLMNTPVKRRQSHDPRKFDAAAVERRSLQLRDEECRLKEERDFLAGRIEALRPWGNFEFPPIEEMRGLRFWFYAVAHTDMKQVVSRGGVWQVVAKNHECTYVVVIAKEEPDDMPVARIHTGSEPLSVLEAQLDDVETALDDLDTQKMELTRWCELYRDNLFLLENQAERAEVAMKTLDEETLYALQAWAPTNRLAALHETAKEFHAALEERPPQKDEEVPTLLKNPPSVAGGADLVTFYMTPGYQMWDPSVVVFFSFSMFFAIILSDAGYAALMMIFLASKWKAMGRSDSGKRMRNLLVTVLGASVVWGIMAGSYFGFAPREASFIGGLKVVDITDTPTMMLISITLGVFHLCLANLMDAWRKRASVERFVPLAWTSIIIGGYLFWLGSKESGTIAVGLGALMLILWGSPSPNIFKRVFGGIFSLTRVTTAFGDVLSYLRLFALGMASASLAVTFNNLAHQVMGAIPGIGIIFAVLIFLFGHVLNLILGIMSGVVHGLRLNVIEFFNWSIYSEGRPFQPFVTKKGGVPWNQ